MKEGRLSAFSCADFFSSSRFSSPEPPPSFSFKRDLLPPFDRDGTSSLPCLICLACFPHECSVPPAPLIAQIPTGGGTRPLRAFNFPLSRGGVSTLLGFSVSPFPLGDEHRIFHSQSVAALIVSSSRSKPYFPLFDRAGSLLPSRAPAFPLIFPAALTVGRFDAHVLDYYYFTLSFLYWARFILLVFRGIPLFSVKTPPPLIASFSASRANRSSFLRFFRLLPPLWGWPKVRCSYFGRSP